MNMISEANKMAEEKMKTKFCKDCKHSRNRFIFWAFGDKTLMRCSLWKSDVDNKYLVTGEDNKYDTFQFCSIARKFKDFCGPEGKLWEKK